MVADEERLRGALRVASALGEAHLGADYFTRLVLPLLERWARLAARSAEEGSEALGAPLWISLSGLPGTGKSTFARLVTALSGPLFGLKSASISLDDVYLTQAERAELARTVHPLLASRGVPGTHDLELLERTLTRLESAAPEDETPVPRFDKLADERVPVQDWPIVRGRPDLILCDGWFFGTEPGPLQSLVTPVNAREAAEDPDGHFRAYVHDALARYQKLFAKSDEHVHIEAPSFEASVAFRIEQGRRELERRGRDPSELEPERVRYFLDLFERVSSWQRKKRPEWIVELDAEHRIVAVRPPRSG